MLSYLLTNPVIDVIVMLGTLVFIHEFGHYAAAKLFGVRVEVFSLGFGKRLFGFRRGDTDYRVSALPLGGYVKMSGENPMEASTGDPGEFMAHPRWQRFIIAIAGPAMNVLFSIAVLTCVYMVRYEHPFFLDQPATILSVQENSVAAKAGLQSNDRIVRVDGINNPSWEKVLDEIAISIGQPFRFDVQRGNQILSKQVTITSSEAPIFDQLGISPDQPFKVTDLEPDKPAIKAGIKIDDVIVAVDHTPSYSSHDLLDRLQQVKSQPVTVTVNRNGRLMDFNMTPELTDDNGQQRYRVGLRSDPVHTDRLPLSAAFAKSLEWNKNASSLIIEVLQKLLRKQVSIKQMSGPIGIAQMSGKVAHEGFLPFIQLMCLISLNLGIFNLLPIPILDGGLILLLIVEGVMRRDIRREVKERVYQAAFVFLIIFAAVVIYNDITKTALGKLLPHM
ncbi:MAG TPA: RIP metalloprotease RseP [Terriglobales bacterium]|nr:RIP metalloprotease RseP [Terriglobales bacterium]